jgi:hypothetical protein
MGDHGADLVEGWRIVDISFAYRHYLIPRRSLKNALTEKGSGYYLAGLRGAREAGLRGSGYQT